jgi:hypothetical protein
MNDIYRFQIPGTKIIFVRPNYGWDSDIKNARCLNIGEIYTIKKGEVLSYRTKVWLEEFSNIAFNAIQFDLVG